MRVNIILGVARSLTPLWAGASCGLCMDAFAAAEQQQDQQRSRGGQSISQNQISCERSK
jgi:hypothetical protein